MHLVDTTMFYALEGGGVRRYLLAKRDWLRRHTNIRHTILAPGGSDSISKGGVVTVKSLPLFFSNGYRFPVRLARWRQQIVNLNPDLIEVGDPYGPAWAALKAGRQLGVPVIGFYHSDLVRLIQTRFGSSGERAGIQYVRRLYQGFDVVIAPSRFICDKLQALSIDRVIRQPLGVDTELFHP
ncbi:MAG: glycosyltransferase, partial [Burkholderiales bacterium]|nr:glycosyltransferase [Burkholderiales bacterium]